jgi:hypothetical protein
MRWTHYFKENLFEKVMFNKKTQAPTPKRSFLQKQHSQMDAFEPLWIACNL